MLGAIKNELSVTVEKLWIHLFTLIQNLIKIYGLVSLYMLMGGLTNDYKSCVASQSVTGCCPIPNF